MCRTLCRSFILVWGVALVMHLIGLLGVLGMEQGPLSGLLIVLLGLPWILLVDHLPHEILVWVAAAMPAVNYVLIRSLCRARRRRI